MHTIAAITFAGQRRDRTEAEVEPLARHRATLHADCALPGSTVRSAPAGL